MEKLIKTYRTTYPKIVQFWYGVEKAFKWVVKHPRSNVKVGILKFYNDGHVVSITLPSGRELYYTGCALSPKRQELRCQHSKLYGAMIVENIVQSVSRDLLTFWIRLTEKRGTKVVMHTYDECVCILPEDDAENGLQRMSDIMTTNPTWSEGLPLAAEGILSKGYTK